MKKALSLLLVLVMALGMSVSSFAALMPIDSVDLGDWNPQVGITDVTAFETSYIAAIESVIGSGNVTGTPGTTQGWAGTVPVGRALYGIDGKEMWFAVPVTDDTGNFIADKSDLRKQEITFRSSVRGGAKAFDNMTVVEKSVTNPNTNLKEKFMAIVIKMADPFVSTSELDFEIRIIPQIDGKSQTTGQFSVSGTYMNELNDDVDADWDYVEMFDGTVVEPQEYVKLIEAEIGEDVSVWTKMFAGKKYYGIATRDDDEKDDAVYVKYPDIDSIITVQSIGLSSTAQYVTFNNYDDTFYVYGADWTYLGKSDEQVAFSSKYYLANKMLDIDEEDVEEPEEDIEDLELDVPEPGPGTGGDGYPENVNDNPGTGA